MNISIHIDADSTANELIAASNFARELAIGRGAPVSSGTPVPTLTVPADEGDLQEPEVTTAAAPAAGTEPPKRRRRSKEEIAAEALAAENARVAAAEAEAQTSNEAGLAEAQAEPETPGEPAAEPEAFETVAATGGKDYTEAEVQQIATVVARTHGADKVKGKIAELGAQRIAGLEQGKLNELALYLEGLK